jgi:hypothetical protein
MSTLGRGGVRERPVIVAERQRLPATLQVHTQPHRWDKGADHVLPLEGVDFGGALI